MFAGGTSLRATASAARTASATSGLVEVSNHACTDSYTASAGGASLVSCDGS
jgi:hypothetical protein